MIKQFDQCELLSTRHITYLSDRPGQLPSPHGIWSVVGIVDGSLLLSKGTALIRVPIIDVKKVADYDLDIIFTALEKVKEDATRSIGSGPSRDSLKMQRGDNTGR